jgi:predicted nucleotidyltransferase
MHRSSEANDTPGAFGPSDGALPDSRVPACLRNALHVYVTALRATFPERVYAVSLYGSLALGGFVERSSNIDFLTVMVGQISEEDQLAIKTLHQKLRHLDPWASRLDGEYAELDQIEAGELDTPCLFVAGGSLAGRREVSKADWLTLVQCGISVIGPEPAAFIPDVPWVDLEQEMCNNLGVYWAPKADSRWLFLSSAWVAFAVLTLCRILYTMDRHAVKSKQGAAEYALGILPEEWHRLIREALRVHSSEPGLSLYMSRVARASETRRFVRAIVQLCSERFLLRLPTPADS